MRRSSSTARENRCVRELFAIAPFAIVLAPFRGFIEIPVAVVGASSARESDPGVETQLRGEDGARDLAQGPTDEHLAPREPDPPELALVQLSPHEIRDVPLRVHEPKLLDEVRLADFRSKYVGAGGETRVDEAVVNPSEDHHGKLARREASVLSESRKCVVLSSNT